jgi:hypothetical protein
MLPKRGNYHRVIFASPRTTINYLNIMGRSYAFESVSFDIYDHIPVSQVGKGTRTCYCTVFIFNALQIYKLVDPRIFDKIFATI